MRTCCFFFSLFFLIFYWSLRTLFEIFNSATHIIVNFVLVIIAFVIASSIIWICFFISGYSSLLKLALFYSIFSFSIWLIRIFLLFCISSIFWSFYSIIYLIDFGEKMLLLRIGLSLLFALCSFLLDVLMFLLFDSYSIVFYPWNLYIIKLKYLFIRQKIWKKRKKYYCGRSSKKKAGTK